MKNIVFSLAHNAADAGRIAADLFASVITSKPDCFLGLATGSTPLPLYRELILRYQKKQMDFSQTRSVNLDEYVGLPADHSQSYRRFMNENLFNEINIKPENTYVPDGMAADLKAACESYEALIDEMGGIDLQLLGIGLNGHIGFNEPDRVFPRFTHVVTLAQNTREANQRFFASLDEVPTHAITMGIGAIMLAKQIILIATGANKAEILEKSFFGPVTPEVPASILQLHPHVHVIADADAMQLIRAHHSI